LQPQNLGEKERDHAGQRHLQSERRSAGIETGQEG
jgi:hypothetical protein